MGASKPSRGDLKARTDATNEALNRNIRAIALNLERAMADATGEELPFVLLAGMPDGSVYQSSNMTVEDALRMMILNLRLARENPNEPVRNIPPLDLDS